MMTAKFQLRVLIAAILATAVAACDGRSNPKNWDAFRIRLTLTVSINGELKSGSSVIEVQRYKGRAGGQMIGESKVLGTAPIVNLGPYGWLFVTLAPQVSGLAWSPTLPGQPPNRKQTARLSDMPRIISKRWSLGDIAKVDLLALWAEGSFPVDRAFPELVWIPPVVSKSKPILPLLPEELSSWIGGDARLVSLTLETTDDPVATKVADPPDWLRALRDGTNPPKRDSAGPYALSIFSVERER